MAIVLILLGIGLVVVGALEVNQATLGASLIALGCFCGILARISQADAHQKQVIAELRALRSTPEKSETAPQQRATSAMAETQPQPERHVKVAPMADATQDQITETRRLRNCL